TNKTADSNAPARRPSGDKRPLPPRQRGSRPEQDNAPAATADAPPASAPELKAVEPIPAAPVASRPAAEEPVAVDSSMNAVTENTPASAAEKVPAPAATPSAAAPTGNPKSTEPAVEKAVAS